MKRSLAVVSALFLLVTLASAANPPANAQGAIRQVLDKQVQAWNRQDLQSFMQGYWHSPELTFFSGATAHRGWDAALERYRRAYQSEGRQMGKLAFSDLQIETLGPAAGFVRGSFHLTMPDGKQPHGVFTLVFRKFPEGWRIIHDHTCAAE
jgi:ketosteroid isomerase-like protein